MKKSNEMLPVFGSRNRKPEQITMDVLRTTGETFVSYGIGKDQIVEFPDDANEVVAVEQPVRPVAPGTPTNNVPKQRLLQVKKYNNKDDKEGHYTWLSLGVLNRTDFSGAATCDFCREMTELPNDWARIEHLFGKKITVTGMATKPFQKFDRQTGVRIDGESENRPTPIIEYVKS